MDDEPVLLSVENAGQDVGLLLVPVEEPLLVNVHDQNVVAVDHLRDAAGRDRVRPRVQVPADPLWQPARLVHRVPEASRAESIRKAEAAGRYESLPQMRLVTKVTGGPRRVMHWCDQDGVIGETDLNLASDLERITFYTEGRAARSRCGSGPACGRAPRTRTGR